MQTFVALATVLLGSASAAKIKLTHASQSFEVEYNAECAGSIKACDIAAKSDITAITDLITTRIDDLEKAVTDRLDVLEAVDHVGARAALSTAIGDNAQDITNIELIKGDSGAKGQQGTHVVGAKGEVGADGKAGLKGEVGAGGAKGAVGADGLKGEVGAGGVKGAVGADGLKGEVGADGKAGLKGEVGAGGAKGAVGADGLKGEVGADGAKGSVATTTAAPLPPVCKLDGLTTGRSTFEFYPDAGTAGSDVYDTEGEGLAKGVARTSFPTTADGVSGWNFNSAGNKQAFSSPCGAKVFGGLEWYYTWCGGYRGNVVYIDGSNSDGSWTQIGYGTIDGSTCGQKSMHDIQYTDNSAADLPYSFWRLRWKGTAANGSHGPLAGWVKILPRA